VHKVYEIESLTNGRFVSTTNERPDKFMNRKFSEGCKFVSLVIVKEGVREYLILDEPDSESRSSDSELVEYVGRVKERLKAKTGWGRNEIADILDVEITKSPACRGRGIEEELGF
jgi:hypothetical protein